MICRGQAWQRAVERDCGMTRVESGQQWFKGAKQDGSASLNSTYLLNSRVKHAYPIWVMYQRERGQPASLLSLNARQSLILYYNAQASDTHLFYARTSAIRNILISIALPSFRGGTQGNTREITGITLSTPMVLSLVGAPADKQEK